MKLVLGLIVLALHSASFAAPTTKAAVLASKIEASNKSTTTAASNYMNKSDTRFHFSTNMLGLLNGKSNVNANFFVMPQVALSVTFSTDAEKTSPLKKTTPPTTQKFTVSSTQYGVGAAYYFFPMEQKWNVSANPYLVTERKSDPIDTESNIGVGLKADGLYLFNSLALGAGLHATSVSGDTATVVNAGVGYIF